MKKGTLSILMTAVGAVGGALAVNKKKEEKIREEHTIVMKNDAIIRLFSQWMSMKQKGITLEKYFVQNNYKKIAIYGMSYVGECLYRELADSEIEVVYGIDKRAESVGSDLKVYTPDEQLEEVDAVVVSAIYFFDDIERDLSEKFDCPIISMEDVLSDAAFLHGCTGNV